MQNLQTTQLTDGSFQFIYDATITLPDSTTTLQKRCERTTMAEMQNQIASLTAGLANANMKLQAAQALTANKQA